MGFTSFVFILISLILEIIYGVSYIISGATESYFPLPVYITISSLMVFLPFLAILFSLINCFTNKKTTKSQKFILLAISSGLFMANLNWLLTLLIN